MTSSLAGLIVLLPQWWTNIGLDPTQQPALLVRLLILSNVLFLGTFICLVLVTRAYNEKGDELQIKIIDATKPHLDNGPFEPESFND